MTIRPNIEMRCGRRQNDAAYQRHRRRSVTGRHPIIIHRPHMEYQCSRGHVPYALDCTAAAESWSDRASFPGKRGRSAMADGLYLQLDVMRMPEPKEFRRLRQATPFLQIWPFRIQIWRRGFSRASSTTSWEMMQRSLVSFKNRLDTDSELGYELQQLLSR